MVEEECRRYRPTKNYLEHLPSLNMTAFETELMTAEFERLQNRLPMEPMSMKRYELPPPPSGKMSEVSAWAESVDNSMAQLEHQSVRAMNLELMLEYGCESWKSYLEIFTRMQAKAQLSLQELKKEIQDVNWQRKSKQTQGGEKLRSLEAQWVMLVSKNYEIEQACAKIEEEIARYKTEKGKELRSETLVPAPDRIIEEILPVEQQNEHTNGNEARSPEAKSNHNEESNKMDE